MEPKDRVVAYDYNDVPTIRKFAQSNKRIRALMGCVGCVSGETEYLSRFGWRRIDEYSGEEIAQWRDGKIEFVQPSDYVSLPENEMLLFSHRNFSMCLSKEHRVPCYDWNGRFSVKSAEYLFFHPSKNEIPTVFQGHETDSLSMSDDLIRFAVMMHADGNYPKAGRKAVICVRKERKKIRIREILSSLGIEWKESVHSSRPTEVNFRFIPPYRGKRFTGFWWAASFRELKIIAEEVLFWDGTVTGEGEYRYSSAHKEDADFIQYACHATGRRATISCDTKSRKTRTWKDQYIVFIRTSDNPKNRVFVREEMIRSVVPAEGGRKYCFTVPSGFFIARHKGSVFVTGNSGKSSGCVIEIIRRAHEQAPGPDGVRRSRWAIVRNTYRQLEDTTIKTVHDWLPPDIYGEWNKTEHNYKITAFPGVELELMFRALDRPDQLSNLLSLEITAAWLNEYREIPKQIFDVLDTRVGRYPPKREAEATWAGIIMDTNPPDEFNPYYKYFEKTKPSNAQLWKQPSGLSPNAENIRNLPRNYYQNLCKGKDDAFINVYVHGQYGYVQEGKAVYASSYNDNTHVSSNYLEPIKGQPLITGWDFGLNCSVVIGQITSSGRVLILRSITSDNMGLERFVLNQVNPLLQSDFFGYKLTGFGDPAGTQRSQTDEKTCYDIFKSPEIGFYDIMEAPSNNLVARQRAVEQQLSRSVYGEQAVVIDPRCDILRKALSSGYRYKKLSSGEFSDVPDKNFYCVDFRTMARTPDGWRKYRDLKVGDRIYGWDGQRVVLDTITAMNVYPETVEVVLLMNASHQNLVYTPNHRCLAFYRGKKRMEVVEAKDLTRSHSLATILCADTIGSRVNKMEIRKITTGTAEGVWCPTTTTGFWLAKRDGAVVITGNSHIANAFEYFCMFLGDQKGRQEREEVMKRMLSGRPQHRNVSSIAGY